jgi:thymidylate kinase
MRAYLHVSLPKKLIVIQATLGAGKSSALNLLRRSLEESGDYRFIFFTCSSPSNLTHEEQLDLFLASVMAHLGIHMPEV